MRKLSLAALFLLVLVLSGASVSARTPTHLPATCSTMPQGHMSTARTAATTTNYLLYALAYNAPRHGIDDGLAYDPATRAATYQECLVARTTATQHRLIVQDCLTIQSAETQARIASGRFTVRFYGNNKTWPVVAECSKANSTAGIAWKWYEAQP